MSAQNQSEFFPKLHNAMWPGLVGKGSPGAEPCIDLDTMLDLTAQAEVDGNKFDGVDLFLFEPHINIDTDENGIRQLAEKVRARGLVVGSVVAPVWAPTGGGSAMGTEEERDKFVQQVRKACHIGKTLRELRARPHGVVRIDSAAGVSDWLKDPETNQQKIADTFSRACDVAEECGEKLAAEGEICWGGMHSWKKMTDLLQRVNRPRTLGFQADMAHTLLYVLGYNEPEDAILPPDWDWSNPARLDSGLKTLTAALRPWTIDFHVAQNDATVLGSGTHDKTGHHCLPLDPKGKLDIPRHAGYWLRDQSGALTKAIRHICWDGCMFPNSVMMKPDTWNEILRVMLAVRNAHGWKEEAAIAPAVEPVALTTPAKAPQPAARQRAAKAAPRQPAKPARRSAAKRKTGRRPATKRKLPPRKRTDVKSVMKKKTAKAKVARKTSAKRRGAKKPAKRK